jgi:predicted glycosyltransferase
MSRKHTENPAHTMIELGRITLIAPGATMASKSAVLGTRDIYINTIRRGYLEERESEYNLVNCFTGFEGVMEKITQLFNNPLLKSATKISRNRLIDDKCDVTDFLVWFIEE